MFVVIGLYIFSIVVEQRLLHLFIFVYCYACIYWFLNIQTHSNLFIRGEEVPFQLEFVGIWFRFLFYYVDTHGFDLQLTLKHTFMCLPKFMRIYIVPSKEDEVVVFSLNW